MNPIMLAISPITKIFGGIARSKAQKAAGQIQSDAAEHVARINQGVYQGQMSGMEPYAALGRQQANTLSRLMTPGVPYQPMQQLADVRSQQASLPPWAMAPGEPPPIQPTGFRPQPPGAPTTGTAVPRGGGSTLGQLAEQMVPLRAPNGSVRAVPASMVANFMSQGAVRV